ncbi:hypothetical protein D1O30_03210 [Methylocystis hirsuta]|uniref:Uncharacterized protein n=1 Tax=Methylocystis hirsuta TaxID=369798 RepID=A0A3M9XKN7_9HYPH|nr:hypothetical protein D1O30_03210 [Methylocystis hirsuta]
MAQAVVRAVERTADERGDVGRAQEPMSRDVSDDGDVVFGQPKGRPVRRTAETRPAARACV